MVKSEKWDKYEAALLIESVFKINTGVSSRADEVRKLSDMLRNRANNLGVFIEEKFRNQNGINLQIVAVESLLNAEMAPRHCAKIFIEMLKLYENEREKFNSVLEIAHEQAK